ncbi:uncharacterized protein LOC34620119 [Cyclospora cayetanensis]|uniref:Uncharacterized protein LOC34620119 n=1 Tax=Cyclospora cayetanensis TaxID=88456 RepID=A0A6P6RYB1_9EIME|nr:uncharacterized protein LOC34620119 [Cyclospora cayetanensis]
MERSPLMRKATVEIQRRPARQGTVSLKPNTAMQKTRSFADPRAIPQLLKQIHAPEEYDEASSVLLCNFPGGISAAAVRNFAAWSGPVVRVERVQSIGGEGNFVVVFSNPEPAVAMRAAVEFLYLDGKTPLFCRGVDPRPNLWSRIASVWGGSTQVRCICVWCFCHFCLPSCAVVGTVDCCGAPVFVFTATAFARPHKIDGRVTQTHLGTPPLLVSGSQEAQRHAKDVVQAATACIPLQFLVAYEIEDDRALLAFLVTQAAVLAQAAHLVGETG